MNLGFDNASEQRGFLQMAIEAWDGPVAVIDGALSEELDSFKREWRELGNAITDALDRARHQGLPAIRLDGDDESEFNQEDAARQIAKTMGLTAQCNINVTGAWYHSSDGSGCVGSVKDTLEEMGLSVNLLDPVDLDASDGLDDEDDHAEELEAAPAVASSRRRPG